MRDVKFRAYYQKMSDNSWMIEGEYTIKDLTSRGITFDQERILWVQYTGLSDKNGKEIYDGDIIEFPQNFDDNPLFKNDPKTISKVEYLGEYAQFNIIGWFGGSALYSHTNMIEVIGNIYENPNEL